MCALISCTSRFLFQGQTGLTGAPAALRRYRRENNTKKPSVDLTRRQHACVCVFNLVAFSKPSGEEGVVDFSILTASCSPLAANQTGFFNVCSVTLALNRRHISARLTSSEISSWSCLHQQPQLIKEASFEDGKLIIYSKCKSSHSSVRFISAWRRCVAVVPLCVSSWLQTKLAEKMFHITSAFIRLKWFL